MSELIIVHFLSCTKKHHESNHLVENGALVILKNAVVLDCRVDDVNLYNDKDEPGKLLNGIRGSGHGELMFD